MKKYFILFVFALLLSQLSFSQDFNNNKLDSYFDALEANDKFMGSVAVSQNGKILYTRAVGFAAVENEINADVNTKYRIGSISKTFTAVMILKAIEAGKLELTQTIDTFFPAIANASKINIAQLLYHRSGIHSFTNNEDYLTWNT
ncbi:Beta-lactamase [Aequorivita viscosa]|uniref:Beta-lactamase n=1 Tax=Aequorivita viscosa TaxID=797419 RepID=A0A1M6KVH3_9FLAO|nr:Beta-lactamase [Aequorivita viscosa]SHJ62939.1 Beta-lactamase [Aequorivita viscosa]